MWYNDYYKASSYKMGLVWPDDYRLFVTKHNRYLVVHSKKCKQCKSLPHWHRWTGTRACVCGNPYIHRVRDDEHYRSKREYLKKEYKKACDAFSHANLTGRPLSELQSKRERLRYLVYG
jgi:hypothetical protein